MTGTTTIRVSKKTRAKLEKLSALGGFDSISKAIDYAVEAAEDKLNKYHGNIDSLIRLRQEKSGFHNTSEKVDEILANGKMQKERHLLLKGQNIL